MEHLKQETVSGAQLNLDALYQICPQSFTESKDPKTGRVKHTIDFEKLRLLLGDNVAEGDERYDFSWVGKRAALQEAAKPIRKTLRPCPEESVDWENTKNLYIEGDNLEVLKLLQNSYMGKVKMIYIDPPYNTGNDFVYHDDFHQTKQDYDLFSGDVTEEGERLVKNTESNGRFHSDWCSMIYSRLLSARSFLTDDGVILISIDDSEIENLRKICDEVFGEPNFVAQMIWQGGKTNTARFISTSHEYILIYAKSISYCSANGISWKEKKQGLDIIYKEVDRLRNQCKSLEDATSLLKKWYKNDAPEVCKAHAHYCNIDKVGVYCMDNVSRVGGGKYKVVNPINGHVIDPPSRGWVFGKEEDLWKAYKEGILEFQDNDKLPVLKRYLHDNEYQLLDTVFYKDRRGAKLRLRDLLSGDIFDFPKDEYIIQNLIYAFSDESSIIMDFFSGSATTAHSVIELNEKVENSTRRFILVQFPEQTDEKSEAYKAGYKNICEIGKERIRRAGKKILEEQKAKQGDLFSDDKKPLDVGFRVFKCADSNMKDVYYTPADYSQQLLLELEDNIKDDRNDLDLLFGCMLDWGVTLDLPMRTEKVDGVTIHIVNDGDLVACFDHRIPESAIDYIASLLPMRVVLRDSCFSEAKEKMNFFEIFKQRTGWSEDEVRKNVKVI